MRPAEGSSGSSTFGESSTFFASAAAFNYNRKPVKFFLISKTYLFGVRHMTPFTARVVLSETHQHVVGFSLEDKW